MSVICVDAGDARGREQHRETRNRVEKERSAPFELTFMRARFNQVIKHLIPPLPVPSGRRSQSSALDAINGSLFRLVVSAIQVWRSYEYWTFGSEAHRITRALQPITLSGATAWL